MAAQIAAWIYILVALSAAIKCSYDDNMRRSIFYYLFEGICWAFIAVIAVVIVIAFTAIILFIGGLAIGAIQIG